MSFGNIASSIDLIVHGEHGALPLRLRIYAYSYCIQQVPWSVKVGFGRIALCADEDNRLVGVDRNVEPVGRFLVRIGSMRYDDTGHLRSGERTIDFVRQSDPAWWIHIIGWHVGDVLALNLAIF